MLLLMELLLIASASEMRGEGKSLCILDWLGLPVALGPFSRGRKGISQALAGSEAPLESGGCLAGCV